MSATTQRRDYRRGVEVKQNFTFRYFLRINFIKFDSLSFLTIGLKSLEFSPQREQFKSSLASTQRPGY